MNEFELWADSILKGKTYPVGTRRKHGGVMKEKQPDGSWAPVKGRRRKKRKAKTARKTQAEPKASGKQPGAIRSNKRMTQSQLEDRITAHDDAFERHIEDADRLLYDTGYRSDPGGSASERAPSSKGEWRDFLRAAERKSPEAGRSAKWAKYHEDMSTYYEDGVHEDGEAPPERPKGKDKYDSRGSAKHPVEHKDDKGWYHYKPPTQKPKPAAPASAPDHKKAYEATGHNPGRLKNPVKTFVKGFMRDAWEAHADLDYQDLSTGVLPKSRKSFIALFRAHYRPEAMKGVTDADIGALWRKGGGPEVARRMQKRIPGGRYKHKE